MAAQETSRFPYSIIAVQTQNIGQISFLANLCEDLIGAFAEIIQWRHFSAKIDDIEHLKKNRADLRDLQLKLQILNQMQEESFITYEVDLFSKSREEFRAVWESNYAIRFQNEIVDKINHVLRDLNKRAIQDNELNWIII